MFIASEIGEIVDLLLKCTIDAGTEQCCLRYAKVALTNGNCSENNHNNNNSKFACILRIRRGGSV